MRHYGFDLDEKKLPAHIAIIMDGNGRWAQERSFERAKGHEKGYETLKRIIDFNKKIGVKTISVYAFSTENWQRPQKEVSFLMQLAVNLVQEYTDTLIRNNIRLLITGTDDNVEAGLLSLLKEAMKRTEHCDFYTLNIAFNYGGRREIVDACKKIVVAYKGREKDLRNFSEGDFENNLYQAGLPDVDLMIRSGGEMRISNFLLWQSVYAELWFTKKFWPDFTAKDFCRAIYQYQGRKRRFGGL
jgi:undecaprenyl diphosphate synthase